jgi:class 3 adenylate cyclase
MRLLDIVAQSLVWNGELAQAAEIIAAFGPLDGRDPTNAEGLYAQRAGDLDESERIYTWSHERARRTGDRWREQGSNHQLGVNAQLRGDLDEAEWRLRAALEIILAGRTVPMEPWTRAEYAGILVDLGRTNEATQQAERIRELYENGEDWGRIGGWVGRTMGMVAAARGDLEQAEAEWAPSLELTREWRHPWYEADIHYRWGLALADASEAAKALPRLDSALDIYRRIGASAPWLQRVLTAKLRAQGIDPASIETSIDLVASAVGEERPDLREHAAPDGTVTLMFSDIEGSTAINERLGDARWVELLREHNGIVREQAAAHGGFEVKSQGDGFMLAFGSARRALECAIAIQRGFGARNHGKPDQPLHLRIGLHTGEAIREGDDFFGRHVALAARVAAEAQGGEVLVSSLLKELTEGAPDLRFDGGREAELKGFAGTQRVYSLEWDPQPVAA